MNDIIDRIKKRRNDLNMSYQDLANKTGLSKSTLQRYETGSIKNMPIDKLEVIADALNVSPSYLMGWEELNEKVSTQNEVENNIDNKDIEKMVEELMQQQGLMLCGEPITDEDMLLLYNSIKSTIELAKKMKNKK